MPIALMLYSVTIADPPPSGCSLEPGHLPVGERIDVSPDALEWLVSSGYAVEG